MSSNYGVISSLGCGGDSATSTIQNYSAESYSKKVLADVHISYEGTVLISEKIVWSRMALDCLDIDQNHSHNSCCVSAAERNDFRLGCYTSSEQLSEAKIYFESCKNSLSALAQNNLAALCKIPTADPYNQSLLN